MLLMAIIITVVLLLIIVLIPLIANIGTPDNLTNWYTSQFYKVLIPAGLMAVAIVWILYLCLK